MERRKRVWGEDAFECQLLPVITLRVKRRSESQTLISEQHGNKEEDKSSRQSSECEKVSRSKST